jgi:DNA-binding winged helix-turn-helix (wHTH) protein
MNTSLKTVKTTADAALTSANTAITNANKAQVTADGVANNVSNAQSSVTDLTNKITAINGQISAVQSSIATINNQGYVKASQIAGMATADEVAALNKTIAALQASSDGLKAQLAIDEANLTAAQAAIKALQTATTTTPTTTPATTTTVSNVTTALVGNAFTGSTLLNFTAMPINTVVTQSFAFNIINSTLASITNVQLAIGLEILDSSNNVVMAGLPTDATVTITSGGLATMWVAQSTGYKYLLGFTNTSTSGIFGGIGVITQGVGTTQYSVTVTVNSGATNSVPAFQLYPIVKVVSFK